MCGIAGFLDRDGRITDPNGVLVAMSEAIRHRGPDADGHWHDRAHGVGFAFRRLAIQDLSPLGHQPMRSASGRFTIVFNGEVYNFHELRAELTALGASFRGGSDTEVLLAAFEVWGVRRSVERFRGMFAFAVWDAVEAELLLVRDRVGVKPLYYAEVDGLVAFASELKALRPCPGLRFELDPGAIALFVRHAYVPGPHSIHRSIRKVPPGHLVRIRSGHCSLERYWSMKEVAERGARAPFEGNEDEAVDALEELLREAVRLRMIADVPLGAFLSGGLDSSAVAAAMCAVAPGAVRTFTIGVRDPDYDEAPFARAIAAHLGTNHTEQYVDPDDALETIPSLARIWDEPFADSSQIPTLVVSTIARRHVTVTLSGDGGDELFGGYYRYRWARSIWQRLRPLPGPVRSAAASLLQAIPAEAANRLLTPALRLMPNRYRVNTPGDRAHKLAWLLAARDEWDLYRRLTSVIQNPGGVLRDSDEPITPLTDPSWLPDGVDFETRMMAADIVSYLPDDILVKVDRASMSVGLEARDPLLDHRLIEFAFRLPFAWKIRNGTTKWLLRRVLERSVPRELFERPKQGFSIPIERWLNGPLRDWAEHLLDERRLRAGGVWQPEPVRRLWTALRAGGRVHHQLWNVLMFEAWRDEWPDATLD